VHDPRLHAHQDVQRLHLTTECLPAAVGSHPVPALKPIVKAFVGPDMNDLADIADLSREEANQVARNSC
jgi:hypothetical protein